MSVFLTSVLWWAAAFFDTSSNCAMARMVSLSIWFWVFFAGSWSVCGAVGEGTVGTRTSENTEEAEWVISRIVGSSWTGKLTQSVTSPDRTRFGSILLGRPLLAAAAACKRYMGGAVRREDRGSRQVLGLSPRFRLKGSKARQSDAAGLSRKGGDSATTTVSTYPWCWQVRESRWQPPPVEWRQRRGRARMKS